METKSLISAAIAALKKGDAETAKRLLIQAINHNPGSEAAWVLLGSCLEEDQQKAYCFQKALKINPENETAIKLLSKLNIQPQAPQPAPEIQPPRPPMPSPEQAPPASRPQQKKQNSAVFILSLLAGLIVIGIPLWIRTSSSNMPPDFLFQAAKSLVSLTGGSTAPEDLWFPEMVTITPTGEPSSDSFSPTPSPAISTDASLLDRLDQVRPLRNQAIALFDAGNYAEAITIWDQVLSIVPEDSIGFYNRAMCYWALGTQNQRILTQAERYYDLASADLEMARVLNPDMAIFYDLEYQIARTRAGLEEYRGTQAYWYDQALNALAIGIDKGLRRTAGNRLVGELLLNLGRCEEALNHFQTLEKGIVTYDETSADVYIYLAQSHLCLKEYDLALENIDRALELDPRDFSKQVKGIILLNTGQLEESLEIFDELLDAKPHYYGRRYYFRAVIHYELGNSDKAQSDMDTGLANTWGSKGLRSYLLGRLAKDEGEEALALQYLQEAEATLYKTDTPRFYDEIIQLITEIGGASLLATPAGDYNPTPTPITPLTDQQYALNPPPTDLFHFSRVNYAGTGLYDQPPGGGMGFRFFPDSAIKISGATALYLRLETDHEIEELNLRAACVPTSGEFDFPNFPEGTVELLPGENMFPNPDECVPDDGIIYFVIWNTGVDYLLINNIDLKLVAINPDGSETTYGYQ